MDPLPKFLIADDLETPRTFVVHTEAPRFVAEVRMHGQQAVLDPHWQDDELIAQNSPALNDLMRAASDFYRRSLEANDRN